MNNQGRAFIYQSLTALCVLIAGTYALRLFGLDFNEKMVALGGIFSLINIAGLGGAWILYFDKKRVALAFFIIISKYAFLMLIIYWILFGGRSKSPTGHSIPEMTAMALGFVSYLIALAFIYALRNKDEETSG